MITMKCLALFVLLASFPGALLAQQPAPELFLTANDGQDISLYPGWPLIVHTTMMNSSRFNNGVATPLVIAPNGVAWTSAIQFTAVDATGQAHQWPLNLISKPADPSLTLSGLSYVRFTVQMAPADVSALLPGTYQLTATLQVSNSNAWSGIVQSRPVTVQVGPEPTLTSDLQFEKAMLMGEYQTNAGDLAGALSTVQQLLHAQPTNPLAMSAAANLLGVRGYPDLAFFEANKAVITYFQNNPNLPEDLPWNLLSIYQGLLTSMTTPLTGLQVVPLTLPPGKAGVFYDQLVSATGGVTPYTWSILSGSLPTGLTLTTTSNQAEITGTPTAAGAYSFSLKVTDSQTPAATASSPFSIAVVP
jgi:hypothetical protein